MKSCLCSVHQTCQWWIWVWTSWLSLSCETTLNNIIYMTYMENLLTTWRQHRKRPYQLSRVVNAGKLLSFLLEMFLQFEYKRWLTKKANRSIVDMSLWRVVKFFHSYHADIWKSFSKSVSFALYYFDCGLKFCTCSDENNERWQSSMEMSNSLNRDWCPRGVNCAHCITDGHNFLLKIYIFFAISIWSS